jgi:Zn-dependent M32 family carboxypeptidase
MHTLLAWLRTNIHTKDRLLTADELIREVTGKSLSVESFRRHITAKVDALYPAR